MAKQGRRSGEEPDVPENAPGQGEHRPEDSVGSGPEAAAARTTRADPEEPTRPQDVVPGPGAGNPASDSAGFPTEPTDRVAPEGSGPDEPAAREVLEHGYVYADDPEQTHAMDPDRARDELDVALFGSPREPEGPRRSRREMRAEQQAYEERMESLLAERRAERAAEQERLDQERRAEALATGAPLPEAGAEDADGDRAGASRRTRIGVAAGVLALLVVGGGGLAAYKVVSERSETPATTHGTVTTATPSTAAPTRVPVHSPAAPSVYGVVPGQVSEAPDEETAPARETTAPPTTAPTPTAAPTTPRATSSPSPSGSPTPSEAPDTPSATSQAPTRTATAQPTTARATPPAQPTTRSAQDRAGNDPGSTGVARDQAGTAADGK